MGRTGVDARGFEAVRRIRRDQKDLPPLPFAEFKTLVRDQFSMLLIDPEAAMAALPGLLSEDMDIRRKALALIRQVLAAPGGLSGEAEARMQRIARIFAPDGEAAPAPNLAVVPPPGERAPRSVIGRFFLAGQRFVVRRTSARAGFRRELPYVGEPATKMDPHRTSHFSSTCWPVARC